MMMFITYLLETKARRGDGKYGRLYEEAEGRNSRPSPRPPEAPTQSERGLLERKCPPRPMIKIGLRQKATG